MELLSLTWRDVDLQQNMVHLQYTKNGERRTLPLTGYALELMHQHAAACRGDSDFVFPNRLCTRPLKIRDAWEEAIKRAGIEDFCFHDLRHSAASYLAMNGANLAEIGEILGHRSLKVTRRYAHLSQEHTRSVLTTINQVIFGPSAAE